MVRSIGRPRPAWRLYQDDTAGFFSSLGFSSETDVPVTGARGGNNIDVVVKGKAHGIDFLWVIECKHWKTNVTKEKAQALVTVVQNIGADRGYLLSETGFQSGALDVTRNTNVHLGSLAALRADTAEWAQQDLVRNWRAQKNDLVRILMRMHRQAGNDYSSKFAEAAGPIFGLDPIIDEGLRGEFPVPFGGGEFAQDWPDLVHKIEARLAYAAQVAGLTNQPLLTDPFQLGG
ncbi:restriction endonuclease [Phenylobacterium ferrooxidans]|uniref:Restriction endonuclease n=1 Tax=Phenylobacterium ferrooxidans TaxID=2982689 RepID=A0ABW6CUV5_9CAUL